MSEEFSQSYEERVPSRHVERKGDVEGRAIARTGFRLDPAAAGVDDGADERQPEPVAVDGASPVGAEAPVVHLGQRLLRNVSNNATPSFRWS